MSNTRIYLVAACIGGLAQAPRLIEAGTAAAARNHATRNLLTVKPASAKEVAKLIASGVTLEMASELPVEQQPLPGTAGDDGTTGGAGLGTSPQLPDATLTGGAGDDGYVPGEGVSRQEAETAMHEDPAPVLAGEDQPTETAPRRRRR